MMYYAVIKEKPTRRSIPKTRESKLFKNKTKAVMWLTEFIAKVDPEESVIDATKDLVKGLIVEVGYRDRFGNTENNYSYTLEIMETE